MKTILIIFTLSFSLSMFSQNMTNERLNEIYTSLSYSIQGKSGAWQLYIKEIQIISITDSNHNRMRIMSPIMESAQLSDDLIKAALIANFHTALDVKYAITDGVLWSVFIHPLKELSENQVKDALSQVYYANINFGTTFASTSLSFPFNNQPEKPEDKKLKPILEKRRF